MMTSLAMATSLGKKQTTASWHKIASNMNQVEHTKLCKYTNGPSLMDTSEERIKILLHSNCLITLFPLKKVGGSFFLSVEARSPK